MLVRAALAVLLAAVAVLLPTGVSAQVSPRPGGVVTTPGQGAPQPGQVMPPRDAGPQPVAGNAVIRGRITDADTGMPVRRATVQLSQRNMRGEPRATATDDQGRFEVPGPGGRRVPW